MSHIKASGSKSGNEKGLYLIELLALETTRLHNGRVCVLLTCCWLITVVLHNTLHPILSAVAMVRLIYTGVKN